MTVRAEVPVQPFPEGVLKDARNPRQLAEKAKHSHREAAELFERGAVARGRYLTHQVAMCVQCHSPHHEDG